MPQGDHVFFALPIFLPESGAPASEVAMSAAVWSRSLNASIEKVGMNQLVDGAPIGL